MLGKNTTNCFPVAVKNYCQCHNAVSFFSPRMVYIPGSDKKFSFKEKLYRDQLRKDVIMNVYKNGVFGSYRHLPLENVNDEATLKVEHAYINTLVRGDLSSLKWIESHPSHFKLDSIYQT